MPNTALFELARFQVIAAALTPGPSDQIPVAYAFAWENRIYPWFHDGMELHKPFADDFRVSADQLRDLFKMLDDRWLDKNVPTFWELEDELDVRHGGGPWDRGSLIMALRYARLDQRFGDDFYDALLKPQEHPVEANYITNAQSDLGF